MKKNVCRHEFATTEDGRVYICDQCGLVAAVIHANPTEPGRIDGKVCPHRQVVLHPLGGYFCTGPEGGKCGLNVANQLWVDIVSERFSFEEIAAFLQPTQV